MFQAERQLLHRSPGKGTLVGGDSFYCAREGVEKLWQRGVETKSDLIDSMERARSLDNGATWSAFESISMVKQTPRGTHRVWVFSGFVDRLNGRLLTMVLEATLPTDDAIEEGMKNYRLRYRVSLDGSRTNLVDDYIVQKGGPGQYTPEKPFEGVVVGRNAVMLGDQGSETIRTAGGNLLVPVQVSPVDDKGELYNPGGGFTYHDAAVLIGRWVDESPGAGDLRIEWDISPRITNQPTASTRGCCEPTVAQVRDGRLLMVIRGSNDAKPELPGYRWFSVSHDEGRTWTPVQPWRYNTGELFFSPSSMSQLFRHSNGTLYWLGNICPANPRGNDPRYPVVIGPVDEKSLTLVKDNVKVIDTAEPHEAHQLYLSSFHAHEDRRSGEIVLHMSRMLMNDWIADAYVYRITL